MFADDPCFAWVIKNFPLGCLMWCMSNCFEGEEVPLGRSSSNRDLDFESGRGAPYAETPAVGLQEIAMKCGTKVLKIGYPLKSMSHIYAIYILLFLMFCLICFFKHVCLWKLIVGVQALIGCCYRAAILDWGCLKPFELQFIFIYFIYSLLASWQFL